MNENKKDIQEALLLKSIGKLTHSLKGDWCWWKKTQPPVDRTKVLAELVDVWHFLLGLDINEPSSEMQFIETFDFKAVGEHTHNFLHDFNADVRFILGQRAWIVGGVYLTHTLGFTISEVYCEYLNKNKENYERIKGGY